MPLSPLPPCQHALPSTTVLFALEPLDRPWAIQALDAIVGHRIKYVSTGTHVFGLGGSLGKGGQSHSIVWHRKSGAVCARGSWPGYRGTCSPRPVRDIISATPYV